MGNTLKMYFTQNFSVNYRKSSIDKKSFGSDKIIKVSHQDNMFVSCITPYTPLLYSKTGVHIFFLIFL